MKMINKKRERNSYGDEIIDEEEKQSKKFNSAETKKTCELNIKEIKYFIARIEQKFEDIIFKEEEQFHDKNLVFEYRREEAIKIIKNLKTEEDELRCIQQALKYDNTNKTCIYKLLNYYHKKNDKKSFEEALGKYKFCITQKFKINEKGKEIDVDLNKLYKINLPIEELEELPNLSINNNSINDLRNSVVEFFTSYYYISKYITKFEEKVKKDILKAILTIKYIHSNTNDSIMLIYEKEDKQKLLPTNKEMKSDKEEEFETDEEEEDDDDDDDDDNDDICIKQDKGEKKFKENKKNNIMNKEDKKEKDFKNQEENDEDLSNEENEKDYRDKLLESIENYLSKYIYYQDFDLFQMNQPIDYRHNLTLFYNYIIWSLYQITIGVDDTKSLIYFKHSKLITYSEFDSFHDLLFDEYFDKNVPFNETMNKLLQYLLMILSTEKLGDFSFLYDYIHLNKKDIFIDKVSANAFKEKLNKKYKFLKAKLTKGKKGQITFEEKKEMKCNKIKIKYGNYTKEELLSSKLPSDINWLWKNINFKTFQKTNFFTKKDLNYLKFLIKHILSSKLLKKIFDKFNNVSFLTDYYFQVSSNIDDYIERIIFLPFGQNDLNKFATTDRRILSIKVSGFPEKNIYNLTEYRINRIVELSLRVIVLAIHEPCHFIKASYSLITEGMITRNTSNENNNNIEGGYFLEEVFFGWVHNPNNPLDLIGIGLLNEEVKCNNKAIINKKIDLITALKLLDPDIYDHDLNYFRKSIFNLSKEDLKSFSFSPSANHYYKSYIESVIDIETIKENWETDTSINAAKEACGDMCVEYKRYNHNEMRF